MKYSTIKVFFSLLFLSNFICNMALAEYECKTWDFPDNRWERRQHANDLGETSDGVFWMLKPTGKQPQIYSEYFQTLSSDCKTLTVRYSVTGGGQAYARAYFDTGSGWTNNDFKLITMDGNTRGINFTVPSEAVGKYIRILIDLFDTNDWEDRTIYINHITITGKEEITCNPTLSPSSQNISYQGGSNKFQVITNSGCQWSANESSYFLNITSGSSGNGSGYVYYRVDSNTGSSSRTGSITAAGKTFYITQDPPPECKYYVSPTSERFNYYENTSSIGVSSQDYCDWRASSNKSWLQITSGASGSGDGRVYYKLFENTTSSNRSATITIQNETVTITQGYRVPDPGHLIFVSSSLPAVIPPLGGSYYITIKNDGESSIDFSTISPSWVTIVPNQGSLDSDETQRLSISIISVETDIDRSGTINIHSNNGVIEKKFVQSGMDTELTIENIKIKGDDITKNGNVYELSGNLKLGHVRGSYVASISDARAEINFSAKTINIFDNQNFSIIGTDVWKFKQTTWNINCRQGNATIHSQLGLEDAGIIEFDGLLDFENISFSGSSHFSGVFEALGQVNFSINFQNPEVALSIQTGKSFEIWPFKMDILDSSAGFQLNLYDNDFSIEINADLNVLDVGFVDGSVFFSPFSGNKLNLKWDGLENQLIFTGDTEISLPLSLVRKYVDEAILEQLENEGRVRRTVRKKIVNIGLVIRENSFVDFDDASFHLNCSVTAQATDQFEISIDPIELGLDWNKKKLYGQLGSEKDLLSFLKAKSGAAFDFNWGTSDYTLMGDFVLQLWCAHIDLNAGIQFHYQGAKYLKGWTTANMKILKWELAPYAEFYIYSNRIVYNGHSVKLPWKLKNSENNMTLNIDFITERIDGNITTPFNIPDTELSLNANSYFYLNPDDSALNVSAVYKGIDLNWKIYPEPFSAELIKKQGITLSTASDANMRVQSNTNPDRYIEIKPTGEFSTNNMSDMMFSCIRTIDPISQKSWKVISIKPKDSRKRSINETFTVLLDNIQENNALQFTYVQSNNSLARTTDTTRFVVYDEDELQAGKSYSTTIGQLENVSPLVRDDGLQTIENSFFDVDSSAEGLSFDNINVTVDGDEFVIDVVLNQPANCSVMFGENEENFGEAVLSEAETAKKHQFRLFKNEIQEGWVYKVKSFVDEVVVYSGVNVVPPFVEEIDLEKGLVAYYPFNGNANDESGNGNHGVVYGATLSEDRIGNTDKSYYFDGEGDYIKLPLLFKQDQDPMTICAWVKIENGGIVYCENNNNGYGTRNAFYLQPSQSQSGTFSFEQYPPKGENGYIDAELKENIGIWTFVTLVKNNDMLYAYKNAYYIGNTSHTESYSGQPPDFSLIGARYDGNKWVYNFLGEVDDLRFYNRALTEAEINAIYEIGDVILSINPTSKQIPPETGKTVFQVSTNQTWTASTNTTWLTIQTSPKTITVIYEANLGEERTGIITVTAAGATNSPQTITITQKAKANTPPETINQNALTNANTPVDITLKATDIDNDPLSFSIIQQPSNGFISNTPPNIIYTPNKDYQGTDEFTFKANDGKADSNISTVTIQIKPISTKRHFPEIYGNPADETWTIYLASATLDDIDLQPNDEIALFDNNVMVGSYKISEVLSESNQLKNYITAWSTLYNGDGFRAGNPYTFKCWDISEQKEFTCINPAFSNPYSDAYTGNTFPDGDGNYSIVSLDFVTRVKQAIALSSGYQFVSLNLHPEHTEMTNVLATILDNLDFVKDSNGNMLRRMGPNWLNNIGSWKITDGYLIRMNTNCNLNVEGLPLESGTTIPLKTGYQFVAYLLTEPENTLVSFSEILDNLEFAKDSNGSLLRKMGPNWVNNIGDLKPGEGYLLKMNVEDVLSYNKEVPMKRKKNILKDSKTSSHFGDISGNPADNTWTIYLAQAQINESHLEANDEIAIFDGDKLVGAFQLTEQLTEENQNNHYLTAWATLNDGNGYTAGNTYTFKCWDSNAGIEYSTYELTLLNPYDDGYTDTIFPFDDGNYSIAKIVFSDKQHKTGDMNDDGKIDLKDALWILKTLVGME